MRLSVLNRKVHKWGGIVIALPLLAIALSGMVLQFKKEVDWIQPATQRGESTTPSIPFDKILAVARSVPEAAIETWDDIDRLDVRPGKGMVKIQAKNGWEIQTTRPRARCFRKPTAGPIFSRTSTTGPSFTIRSSSPSFFL